MKRSTSNSLLAGAVILAAIGAAAQDGKLSIHVVPKQTYIFVDGHAIGEASKHSKLRLSAGEHKVQFANYGYVLADRDVTVTEKQTTKLDVTMEQVPGTVPGPFGAMTIEGANHDAIMLNGKTPNFFVGHGDEFNHDFWKKQELVVPPGNYQMSVQKGDKEIWSGAVDVPENKRVVIGIPKGVRKTVDWSRGQKLSSTPRFKVGTASATVAVIKPTAQLSASAGQINCGDASQLQSVLHRCTRYPNRARRYGCLLRAASGPSDTDDDLSTHRNGARRNCYCRHDGKRKHCRASECRSFSGRSSLQTGRR